ncbi:hypothetical protein [Nocardia tengchongensis]|uniref:hypothetical protein n=1 Tax=Nocardia tengchongensis TaxID=2055889 RepID=UPI0036991D08
MLERATTSPNLTDRGRIPAVLRVLTELVAWVTLPWGLAYYSIAWSILAVIVLIGAPGVFATPGDKEQVTVAVPGPVTIGFMLLQVAGALWGAILILPGWAVAIVGVLAAITVIAELPRWRWLLTAPARPRTQRPPNTAA